MVSESNKRDKLGLLNLKARKIGPKMLAEPVSGPNVILAGGVMAAFGEPTSASKSPSSQLCPGLSATSKPEIAIAGLDIFLGLVVVFRRL